ncbi:MAG: hypothetical protein JSV22_07295 [Bacteroidales bacterium]|nr:MAG: hypothetical protein JSV22_07295 [Bacteroidales bacterium]
MSYELTYKKKKDILFVKVKGMRSFKTIISVIKDIQQICIKQKTSKVLIDVQELEGHLKTMEAYELPALVFPKIRDKNIFEKSAIVDREESYPYYSFFENVSVNRGFNLRIFTNIDDAAEWLRK